MAKKISIRDISQQLGVSPSTVFRALNSCGDVDAETSARIRALAQAREYHLPERSELPICALILPDKPDHFWGRIRRLFQQTLLRFPCRTFLYSNTEDRNGFYSALSDAMARGPSLLIVAAPEDGKVSDSLAVVGVPVFFICRSIPLVNAFTFETDPYKDGFLLGQTLLARFPHCRRVLCVGAEGELVSHSHRLDGFFAGNPKLTVVDRFVSRDGNKPYAASVLARRISQSPPFDCVYCGAGNPADLCNALDKCRIPPSVPVVAFDNPPALRAYRQGGRSVVLAVSDPESQVLACARAAERFLFSKTFPDRKTNVFSSVLV